MIADSVAFISARDCCSSFCRYGHDGPRVEGSASRPRRHEYSRKTDHGLEDSRSDYAGSPKTNVNGARVSPSTIYAFENVPFEHSISPIGREGRNCSASITVPIDIPDSTDTLRGARFFLRKFNAPGNSSGGWVKSVIHDQGTRRPSTQMSCLADLRFVGSGAASVCASTVSSRRAFYHRAVSCSGHPGPPAFGECALIQAGGHRARRLRRHPVVAVASAPVRSLVRVRCPVVARVRHPAEEQAGILPASRKGRLAAASLNVISPGVTPEKLLVTFDCSYPVFQFVFICLRFASALIAIGYSAATDLSSQGCARFVSSNPNA